jgi:glycosyltransferase involved in cell wall biosynthesis
MTPNRRIAIVCQPWDNVAAQSGSSIVIIAYQLARRLAGDSYVTIYGRRGPGQKQSEIDGAFIEFKRLKVLQIPQGLVEISLGILSCYFKKRINYIISYFYHPFYALRVGLSIRASKCDIVIVYNFLQHASIIRLFNPSANICLSMQCEWLTQFATPASERRLSKVDLIIGCSDYITEGIRTRFPAVTARCHTVYNGVDTDRFCPVQDFHSQSDGIERLLYVGRLSPEKGVHVLIQAFKILAESRPRLHLDLVGASNALHYLYLSLDPQDRANASLEAFFGVGLCDMIWRQLILRDQSYLGDLTAEAAGDDRIVLHGRVLQTDTIDFYRRAAALVFPSSGVSQPGCRRSKRRRVERRSCQRTAAAFQNTYCTGKLGYWWHGAKPRNWQRPSARCSIIPRLRVPWARRADNGRWSVSRGMWYHEAWLVCSRVCPGSIPRALQDLLAIISQECHVVLLWRDRNVLVDPRLCPRPSLGSIGTGSSSRAPAGSD